jgi:mannose-6-phosphate isomerase-like protein (cupin superfamily)
MDSLPNIIDVDTYDEEGYAPVVDFQHWRVALLNYIDELEADKINNFHMHEETDEVFVLLQGRCILFAGEIGKSGGIDRISALDMKPNQLYTVKKGVYHTHTLSEDAKVLIVENQDTGDHNTPMVRTGDQERVQLEHWVSKLWGTT